MRDNARRYNLDVTCVMACGIGAMQTSYQCSILCGFGINIDGTQFNYPAITTEDLKDINKPQFEERVCRYLEHINIESDITKERLVEEASFYDPLGDFVCRLNPDFLVYKFLDGVRVVNIGTPNGYAEYKVYPFGDDPSGYTWQTNGTFLSLNFSQTYVFEVRDVVEGSEYCKVSKTVLLSTLVPSTTEPPPNILIFVDEVSNADYGPRTINWGYICADPDLVGGENVVVGYSLCADARGFGEACARLCCKPQGSSTFTALSTVIHDGLQSVNSTVTLRAGDVVKYNLETLAPSAGSEGCACIDLLSVNGQDTTLPTIDVGRCCVSIIETVDPLTVTASVQRNQTQFPTNGITARGEIPLVPNNFCGIDTFTLELTSFACGTIGATSSIQYFCKTSGVGSFNLVSSHNNSNPQPSVIDVPMSFLDELCYTMTANAVNCGACGSASLEITNAVTTFGINPVIDPIFFSDSIEKIVPPKPVTVSICNQTDTSIPDESCAKDGFINIQPVLSQNYECATIEVCGYANFEGDADSCVAISCKPDRGSGFVQIVGFDSTAIGSPNCTASFIVYAGDCICYEMFSEVSGDDSCADTELKLCAVSGVGVAPTINLSKCIVLTDVESR